MDTKRYPIGKFSPLEEVTPELSGELTERIANLPISLRKAVHGLTRAQLDTPYREGGWTVRQVVHHIADAHMNAFIRFKLALTENNPAVKTYDEVSWAQLDDARIAPIGSSLSIIDGLHNRWVVLITELNQADLKKQFVHPDLGNVALEQILQLYAWHGDHHVSQITSLRERMNW